MVIDDLTYFVEEGVRSVRHNKFISVVAIVTIAFALMIFGIFLLVYSNVRHITDGWVQQVELTAYVREGFNPDRVEEIKKLLWQNREIARIEFVSKEEALSRFRSDQKNSAYLLDGLEGNPLPASFEIGLSKSAQSQETMDRLVKRLSRIPEFKEIQYGKEWTRSLMTFLNVLRLIGVVLGGLLGVAILFIIANTVRLTVYARRDELAVMRLIGATKGFIRGPFLIEGLFQGLIGAVLSLVALFGIYHFWVPRLRHGAGVLLLQNISISFLSLSMLSWIVAAGMVLGLFGSLMSLGRFLKI
jgi:cell division transport system permease protein